jgi:NDP-sugar pyrophosphorylase family protein
MRAMVLAAGLGTRLQPLTLTTPKPLVEVAGRPMIDYALDLVRSVGIVDVAINLHHLGGQIRTALGDGSAHGLNIRYFPEDPILDTGGGIAAARGFLDGDSFMVLNSDTITDVDLGAMIDFHRARGATATMMLRPDPEAARYGVIEIDAAGRIRRFLGKPAADLDEAEAAGLRGLMFGGVHIFEPRLFAYMGTGVFSITRETYPRMLAAGEPLCGFVHDGFWRVLDTHAGLAEGRAAVQQHLSK